MVKLRFDHRSLSLRSKLVLLIATLLAAVSLFLLFFFPGRMDALARTSTEQRATGLAEVLGHAVASGLEFDDADSVAELLSGLARASDARYAVVRRADGSTLAKWGNAEQAGKLEAVEGRIASLESNQLLHVAAAIRSKGGARGTLLLGFSLDHLAAERRANLLAVGTVSGLVFAVGLAVVLLIGTVLARPLRRMSSVALQIANGDLLGAEAALGGRAEVQAMVSAFENRSLGGDEAVQLAGSFAQMLHALRETSLTLQEAAQLLNNQVTHLSSSAAEQGRMVTRQAQALQQTQQTAEAIRKSSMVAAQESAVILKATERADDIRSSGETSIEESLSGLSEIGSQVGDIARQITLLGESTRQIGEITGTVKDFADQANLLALNASVEAARSGEHGRGFAVVAGEIRRLADQSLNATLRVRAILQELLASARSAVRITEAGANRIAGSLTQVKASGENLRALSEIVTYNTRAVKQIAAAVNEQNAGIVQVFEATSDLSAMMGETVQRIDSTNQAIETVREVSQRVFDAAKRYRV